MSTAPYISMLSNRGIDWHDFSSLSFEKAKQDNKLLYIHIGRITSFECRKWSNNCLIKNPEAVKLLDRYFVPIVLDSEEFPEVFLYTLDLLLLTGSFQGVPFNLFLLPNGRPVYASSVNTPEEFLDTLKKLSAATQSAPDLLQQAADELNNQISHTGIIQQKEPPVVLGKEDLMLYFNKWLELWRTSEILPSQSPPRYPFPLLFLFLLEFRVWQDESAYELISEYLRVNFDTWLQSGLYDPVDGGFFHAVNSAASLQPDFEKALPDNTLYILLFALAYKQTEHPLYKAIAQRTISFIETELATTPPSPLAMYGAGIYEKRGEANYYTFTLDEIRHVYQDKDFIINDYLSLDTSLPGDFPQLPRRNIEWAPPPPIQELIQLRKKRSTHPGLLKDKRIFCGYNALYAKALIYASTALTQPSYLEKAETIIATLLETFNTRPGHLERCLFEGKTSAQGTLFDYAYLINALLHCHHITGKNEYYEKALEFYQTVYNEFYNPEDGMFFKCSDAVCLVSSRRESNMDGMKPSLNSVMTENLLMFYQVSGNTMYREMAEQQLYNILPHFYDSGPLMANWARQIQRYLEVKGQQKRTVSIT